MIRFVMIDSKLSPFNFEKYTDELMDNVRESLSSTDLSFYRSEESKRSCYIYIAKKEYFVDFTFIATPGRFQLKVDIREKDKEDIDKDLHDLKIKVKDLMIEDWKQCVWLTDHQSEGFAENLYKNVHSVENGLRRVINTVLFHRLGGDWWSFMPSHLTNKYSTRISGYQDRAPSFKNVHANLLSIDTDDLVSILQLKTYKMKDESIFSEFNPFIFDSFQPKDIKDIDKQKKDLIQFKHIMSDIINNKKSIESHQKALTNLLKEQMETEIDFWEEFFSPWFSCTLREFSGKWDRFSKDRNHVAHNKLIDNRLYQKFKKGMEELLAIITEAEENFEKEVEKEATQFIEYIEEMAIEDSYKRQRDEKQAIAEEAGIEIRDTDQIISLFEEHISGTFEGISDEIYYNRTRDIEVFYDKPLLTEKEKIFEIEHNILKRSIYVKVEPDIDESDGSTSKVHFQVYYNEDFRKSFDISYVNGEAEFNENQGNFMAKKEEKLDVSSLEELESFIYKLVEEGMPEISEDDLASFVCEECRESTVNLSEENDYELGTCINCGHENEVGECLRCGAPLDQQEDDLCESCTEWIEDQK
ncbi:zinc ribbon domain-containing protein [Priestia aryabhattai]|uniref:hypothetical protein n=1 Tax=Priestia aryabhattai TaxID=412384 RepID=UPI003D2A52E4